MAVLAGTRRDLAQAVAECQENLANGKAAALFEKMIRAQGGKAGWEDSLPRAEKLYSFKSPRSGFVHEVLARQLGLAGLKAGVGRVRAEDPIDPATGFEVHVAPGDEVREGQVLLSAHLRNETQWEVIQPDLLRCFRISFERRPAAMPLVMESITKDSK
jgi:thymidine phosphorylase